MINEFISIWIGNSFLLSMEIVFIIIVNFYMRAMRQTTIMYNTTLGLFWNDRYKPWIEALINLLVSIVLLFKFGIVGVFLGTFISTITTSLWVDPYILYKYGFNKKLMSYFNRYGKYTLITLIAGVIVQYIMLKLKINSLMGLILKAVVCFVISNLVFIAFTFNIKEFKYFKELIQSTLRKIYKRN